MHRFLKDGDHNEGYTALAGDSPAAAGKAGMTSYLWVLKKPEFKWKLPKELTGSYPSSREQ